MNTKLDPETLQIRVHGDAEQPALIYLPGLHGDWTLVSAFRCALANRVRFVEITYPRTLAWSLNDYAVAVEEALDSHGITRGWLLGESFSSQVVWPLCERQRFEIDGVILAGGFVRHPARWAVRMAERVAGGVPLTWLTRILFGYSKVARFRFRNAPETLRSIDEFIARRTELDRQAAKHRLHLIAANDLRDMARRASIPVCMLTGLFDPVVPWVGIGPWLRRNCPGFRDRRIIWRADHNVLGTAPVAAAEQVLKWINEVSRMNSSTTRKKTVPEPPIACSTVEVRP